MVPPLAEAPLPQERNGGTGGDRTAITYVVSGIDKALNFEWTVAHLDRERFRLRFLLLNPGPSTFETFLRDHRVPVVRVPFRGKQDLPRAVLRISADLLRHHADAVHCHLFDANIAGLLAARLTAVRQRVYTRHYATFHHRYHPRAVRYDRAINLLATDVVAVSENVRRVLIDREHVTPQKVTLIHHGLPVRDFEYPDPIAVARLRQVYVPAGAGPVVGVISRYVELKGLQFVIPAFARLRDTHPRAHLVLANATGPYAGEVARLLANLPPGSFTEIRFEKDLFCLYALFDAFVHVPIDPEIEAFGQTYVEALAAGVPSVFTLSGVATEFVRHRENAWVVPFEDTGAILEGLRELLADVELRDRIVANGRRDVRERFDLSVMIARLEALYARGPARA